MRKTAAEYSKIWRAKHPHGNREALAKFRSEHPDSVKASKRRYYEKNKDEICAKSKAWREANRERWRETERRGRNTPHRREARRYQQWHRRYGLAPAAAKALLAAQGHACAICSTLFAQSKFIHADHCHQSNQVRGFLCHLCNVGLGSFRDNQAFLLAAVEYLRRPSHSVDHTATR